MTQIARKQVATVFLLIILFIAQSAKVPAVEFHFRALEVEVDEHGQRNGHYDDDDELKPKSSQGSALLVAGTREYRPLMAFENQQQLQEEEGCSQNKTGGGYSSSRRRRRRKLVGGPFQLCLVCKCCVNTADLTTCANMPCCFGIDCQLPNKPFGVCAFVPKTCNCTSCPAPAPAP